MERLYVLYDDRCGLCRWVKNWAKDIATYVDLVFVPAGSAEAQRVAPGVSVPGGHPEELVVVSEEGHVYLGDSAYIMCFYATVEFREWSLRLATPALRPLARKAFATLSRNRVRVSDWLGMSDHEALNVFERVEAPACEFGAASGLQKIHQMVAGPEPRDASPGR